jgi:RsiW-degrading membrane proteinase PrsW (M82 family)
MYLLNLAPAAIVAAAIAPALLLLWLVVAADSRPEPPRVVWTAFVLGALSIYVLDYITNWLVPHIPVTHHPWLAVNETALFIASIPEETLKIFVIAIIAYRARAFDEPMDGVVYGTAVGLGFAAHENIGYLTGANDWGTLAIVRGILTVPFHGALGAIAGAYIANARFGGALGAHRREHWVRARLLLSGWLIPVVLHALFEHAPADTASLPRPWQCHSRRVASDGPGHRIWRDCDCRTSRTAHCRASESLAAKFADTGSRLARYLGLAGNRRWSWFHGRGVAGRGRAPRSSGKHIGPIHA